MKTKIIFENQNDCAKDKSKEFEGQYMKAILLALLEGGKINQAQYDECKRRLKINQLDFQITLNIMCVEKGRCLYIRCLPVKKQKGESYA